MRSFFEELRTQSRGTRELMFGLCVVITVSMVGVVWFRSFEERLFVGLNRDPQVQEAFYAQRQESEETVFANIGTVFGNLRATLGDIAGIFSGDSAVEVSNDLQGSPHPLPISEDK